MTQIALITGGNRGLGFEITRQVGQSGAETLVAARGAQKRTRAAAELAAEGLDAEDDGGCSRRRPLRPVRRPKRHGPW